MREELVVAKEYLRQAYKLSREIDYSLQELMRLEELAVSIQAVNYSEKVQSSNSKDILDSIEKIDMARKRINDQISNFTLKVEHIKGLIRKIENKGIYDVLWGRYILFQSWEVIADKLSYSVQHVYRLHKKGLEEISEILKEESKCDY